jgi:type II secretory pathway component PulF
MSGRWADMMIRLSFGTAARIDFYEQVALLLDNGVSLENTLKELRRVTSEDGKKRGPMVDFLTRSVQSVKSGQNFSDAIRPWVSGQEAAIISAGEASGTLLDAFRRATMVMTQRSELKKKLAKELAMPVLATIGMAAAYTFIGFYMAPILTKMMPLERWEGDTRRMLDVALFMSANVIWIVLAIVGFIAGFAAVLPRLTGRLRDRLDGLPVFNVYRLFAGASFLLNISTKIAQGIPLEDALKRERAHASPYLLERIDDTARGIKSGLTFGDALQAAEHNFPDRRTIGAIRVISSRKGFDQALEKFTIRWFASNLNEITKAAMWLRVIAMIVIAAGVISLANGVFGIQQNAQSAFSSHP